MLNQSPLGLPKILDKLKKHFNVVDSIHVANYDNRMDDLYLLLNSLKKEKFNINDRIIFIFDDTDYYINNVIGITLHNLQKILYSLDIPNYFCIIITHQSYLLDEIKRVNKLYGHDLYSIFGIDAWIDLFLNIHHIKSPLDLNFNQIEKSYIMLSRVTRRHRVLLYSLLKENDILDKGLVSFSLGYHSPVPIHSSNKNHINNNSLCMLLTSPWSRCNEDWLITDPTLNTIYSNFLKSVPLDFSFKNFTEPALDYSSYYSNTDVIQRAFLYVGVETMFHYPGTYLSEKSFKGFASLRPFVIVGPAGNLNKLKDYGFKTFDRWWDEGYDNIENSSDRMKAVFKIIKYISNLPPNQLIELGKEMEDILQYNYDFLVNKFASSQLEKISLQCEDNLNR